MGPSFAKLLQKLVQSRKTTFVICYKREPTREEPAGQKGSLIENIPIKCFPQIRLCFDGIHREPSLFFLLIAFAHDKVLDSLLILFTFEKVTLSRPLAEKQPYTQQYGPIFLLACSSVPLSP